MYEHPNGTLHGTGLLMPDPNRKKLVAAETVMPIYERKEIIRMLAAAGGEIALPDTGLPPTNQTQHEECWRWQACLIAEQALFMLSGKAVRLDVSIMPSPDDGADIHEQWNSGIEPHGICPASFFGTDPEAKGHLPDFITSVSRFPAGWQAEAAKRKGLTRVECNSFLEALSAVINGHAFIDGVQTPQGGHCTGGTVAGVAPNGQLYKRCKGTWGKDYGSDGRGWGADTNPKWRGYYTLTEDECSAAYDGGYGCMAVISVSDTEDIPDIT